MSSELEKLHELLRVDRSAAIAGFARVMMDPSRVLEVHDFFEGLRAKSREADSRQIDMMLIAQAKYFARTRRP